MEVEVMSMKEVVTVKEMRMMEDKTFKDQHISSFELMEKVGQAMFQTFLKDNQKKGNLLLICGTGNNGGDALVFGEEASRNRFNVKTIIVGDVTNQTDESLTMTKRYTKRNSSIHYVNSFEEFHQLITQLTNIDCIVDGLFGIGLTREVTGLYHDVIEWINQQNTDVLSIDVPSGLHADTGKIMGVAVKATKTYTVEIIKQGLLLEDALDMIGELTVIQVDMEKIENNKYYIDTFRTPQKRFHNTHKYHYKNVLTIGGQKGVMGAITLAGHSALIAGAGLSTISTNVHNQSYFIQTVPELMYETIDDRYDLQQLMIKKDAVLFGLGARKTTTFEEMVYETITKLDIPIVLDANGIQLLKKNKERRNNRTIITPHYGEFAKLMNVSVQDIKEKPLEYIKKCIKQYHCEIVLKGPATIYATNDKIIYLNQGTPALAKAGSGDVLAGILLTYVARDLPIEQGILLHMLAAQEASKTKHMESVLATDIIENIPKVYQMCTKEEL
jgi:NAD(P)H-hydrate epimerase